MAQLTKTSSAPNYSVSTMQTILTNLIATMNAGQQINAADIVQLKTATYDAWLAHTHTVTDTIGIDGPGTPYVYGVAPGQTTTETSSVPYQGSSGTTGYSSTSTPVGVASGNAISAADINTIITLINEMATHYHTVTDQVGTIGVPTVNLGTSAISVQSANGTGLSGGSGTSAGPLDATLVFNSNGSLQSRTQDPNYGYYYTTLSNMWVQYPSGMSSASGYEIKVDINSTDTAGGLVTGTYDGTYPATSTWTNMGSGGNVSVSFTCPTYHTQLTQYLIGTWHLTVSIRAAGTTTVLATQSVNLGCVFYMPFGGGCCFPAGVNVLMADGSTKLIEDIKVGDLVMGMGTPETITEVSRPLLGNRKMIAFGDDSLSWSEEHAFWTKDSTDSQWWWSANANQWRIEAQHGVIGGLFDNNSIRTSRNVAAWAHTTGWKTNTIKVIPGQPSDQLYLPRTTGSPIIVNGYVVGAGVNQQGYDYTKIDWNQIYPTLK